MQVLIEDVGICKKKLAVEVPPEDVSGRLNERIEQMRRELALPGFRRGRVPRRIVELRFGKELRGQVREELIRDYYKKALEEKGLDPVGEPELEADEATLDPSKALSFKVTVEVKPKIEVSDYKGLTVTRPASDPLEQEIDQRIERLRVANARMAPVDQGKIEEEDQIIASIAVVVDGKEAMTRERTTFGLTSPRVAGIPVKRLPEALLGKVAGDEVSVPVTLPEGIGEGLAGKEGTLRIKVTEFRRAVLPEKTDQWAKEMGYDSLQALRDAIAVELRGTKENSARKEMLEQINQQLLARYSFDIPQSILETRIRTVTARHREILASSRLSPEEIDKQLDQLAEPIRAEAEKSVRIQLIYEAIAKKERILITEEELDKYIADRYASQGLDAASAREQLDKEGLLDGLRLQLRFDKVADFLLNSAHISAEPSEAKAAGSAEAQAGPSGEPAADAKPSEPLEQGPPPSEGAK